MKGSHKWQTIDSINDSCFIRQGCRTLILLLYCNAVFNEARLCKSLLSSRLCFLFRLLTSFDIFWHLLTSSDHLTAYHKLNVSMTVYIYTHVIHILHMQDYPCMKHIETWCNDSQILSVSYRFISFGINRYKQSSSAWMRLRIPRAKKKKQRRMAWRRDMNMILVTYLVISVEW